MTARDFQTLPNTNDVTSREGVVECTYNLLRTDEDSVRVEGTDNHLACPKQEAAAASASVNIGVQICFAPDNLIAEDHSENCCIHESNGTMEPVFSPIADVILPSEGGGEDPVQHVSAFVPKQRQSPKTAHNEDPSKLFCVPTESKSAITDSIVLKQLLRKRRYFDSEDSRLEGLAAKLRTPRWRKVCYFCGLLRHDAKKCPKRRPCYTCRNKGHIAADCPMNIEESERICLRCGEKGHEISSCTNEYCPDDLKKMQCYVCNELGHIFCGNYIDGDMPAESCYNCGESGHSGLQCLKQRQGMRGAGPPSMCYKCGEGGHLARNCIKSSEASRCHEGGQDAGSHIGPETNDADLHQNHRRRRTSRNGRSRRQKRRGVVDCTTVQ